MKDHKTSIRCPWIVSLLPALALAACEAGEDYEDQRAEAPEAPAPGEGMQFVQPETIVPAGEERMVCWIPDWTPDQDHMVTSFKGYQGSMGHHVVALASGIPREPGTTFDCTSLEQMTTLEPLILPDPNSLGGERSANLRQPVAGHEGDGESILPDGYAVRLKKDTKIVIQSHYVNYSDKDILVSDVAHFDFSQEQDLTEVGYLILNHNLVDVPPGEASLTKACETRRDYNLLLLLGHMHETGSSIELLQQTGNTEEVLYSVDEWTVEYRDEPPLELWEPEQALQIPQGSRLQLNCNYDNQTGESLRFPAEMCTSVAYYFPVEPGQEAMALCGGDEGDGS